MVAGDELQYNIASAPFGEHAGFFVAGLSGELEDSKPVSVLLGGLLVIAAIPVILPVKFRTACALWASLLCFR